MPSKTLQAMSKKYNIPIETLEKYWEVGKEEARKKGYRETDEDFYPYTMGVVKQMINSKPKEDEEVVDSETKEESIGLNIRKLIQKKLKEKGYISKDEMYSILKKANAIVQEYYLRDPQERNALNTYFIWKNSSNLNKAVAWAVFNDKPFEITFKLIREGMSAFPYELRIALQNFIENPNNISLLDISIDPLVFDINGTKIGVGENFIPSATSDTLRKNIHKIFKDYFDQFGTDKFSLISFSLPYKYNYALINLYDYMYVDLLNKFRFLRDGKELANEINEKNSQYQTPVITQRKYYILINTKGPQIKFKNMNIKSLQ